MGKSTISMAIFNSYVTNYQRVNWGELITPISRAGLWYANNELVTGAYV